MFLAPLSVPPSLRAPPNRPSRPARRRMRLDAALFAWLLVGCAVVLLVPAVRGGRLLGATLPFWLIAAPLVDLAWVAREGIAACARMWFSAFRSRRPAPRNVRRQRLVRAAACSAARS
jgi:hypothetical protein